MNGGGLWTGWQPAPRRPDELARVAEQLRDGDDWLIVTHERPDGDAVGSALAMAHVLEALGKSWRFAVEEPLPKRFSYLPLFSRAYPISDAVDRQFQHVVAVDCADRGRFEKMWGYIADNARVVNIDHHQTNPRYGTAWMVDADAAATCELVYHVVRALDIPLGVDLATCLYTGILTDTGGFALPNTTREVHQIAAELVASGVKPYDVAEPALESRTWAQMRLIQMALNNLTVSEDGRYAILYVTEGMLEGAGCTDDDTQVLVNFPRSIDTVEVGALFREIGGGRVKVSLRSKRTVDVARIAQHWGGGGHIRAAACVLTCDLPDAIDQVCARIEEALAEA
ncbi:bifunctional oligoribonuclease/PAP phosphatase NrnA [Alicyclobacillus sp.]|uniref:DHH family phosphoesterase n=1 Tax=Alicyclobacillus sp. TaxID=61169 RepID=UPI0025C5A603|nr:bifunctional oligoribonuclease/PAP phosphatase NrnA [Alicyclobacillus sp.]MCL6516209.1 bifunctional oligoribonuclease/PAP phosphatase NrnA [Alicyclobacillus sp.]